MAAHRPLDLELHRIDDPVPPADAAASDSSLTRELHPASLDLYLLSTPSQSLEEHLLVEPLAEPDPLFRRETIHHHPVSATAHHLLEKVPVQVPAVTLLVVFGHHPADPQLCALLLLAQLLQADPTERRHLQYLLCRSNSHHPHLQALRQLVKTWPVPRSRLPDRVAMCHRPEEVTRLAEEEEAGISHRPDIQLVLLNLHLLLQDHRESQPALEAYRLVLQPRPAPHHLRNPAAHSTHPRARPPATVAVLVRPSPRVS